MMSAPDEEVPWHKVFIVGGPGSGKTTLARRIARRTGSPVFELDLIGYEGGAGPERSLDARLRDVAAIAVGQAWVAEGTFTGWTDALAEAADVIIWLDVPWRVAVYRIVSRHVRASMGRRNKHRGVRKLWAFICSARSYYTGADEHEGRLHAATWVHRFDTPVVVCRSPSDLHSLFKTGRFGIVDHRRGNRGRLRADMS